MPVLFIFLLKVNVALLLFCAGYFLVLRRLTFYTLNRVYLVNAILFATIYPEINISGFARQHQQIVKPVEAVVFNWQAPVETAVKPLSQADYWYWVEIAFWAGVILLALRLLLQLYSLYKLYRNSSPGEINGLDVRVIKGKNGPFSFWRSIYINPANHQPTDLEAILLHEQVHVNEWHTLDILLAELSSIFYWFNPGVWLMKKAIRENIEFITDRKILKKGVDSKQYQYSLVNAGFAVSGNSIVNHFNLSTIKKRIIMMNIKKSSKLKLARYAFLIPALVILLLGFTISKAALAKKSNFAYNSLKTAGKTFVIKNDHAQPASVAANKVKPIRSMAADTIKKGSFLITTSSHSDSLTYVINGVKASKTDFMALDSSKIYSIEIMPAADAHKIFDQTDNKNNVLFVTTNDSESGKKFKEKIDRLNNMNNNVAVSATRTSAGSLSGDTAVTANISYDAGTASGAGTNTSASSYSIVPAGKNVTVRKIKGKPVLVRYAPDSLHYSVATIDAKGPDSTMVYAITTNKGKVYKAYTIRPKYQSYALKGKTYNQKLYKINGAFTINSSSFSGETDINHISEKLIMIDGKEATERDLKKLSAADIESMSVKTGDEVSKQYGDKAKNGVVFITTKKAVK